MIVTLRGYKKHQIDHEQQKNLYDTQYLLYMYAEDVETKHKSKTMTGQVAMATDIVSPQQPHQSTQTLCTHHFDGSKFVDLHTYVCSQGEKEQEFCLYHQDASHSSLAFNAII